MMNGLSQVRHLALDMDGTIYSGGTLFETTLPFLAAMAELGIGHTFLTNNSSKSSRDYLTKLAGLGIAATPEQLYTSTQATIEYLQQERPQLKRLFILGTPSMIAEMTAAGFVSTADSAQDVPDAVLIGFDTTLNYARLCRAAYWIGERKPFIATHPDRICPTDEPTVLVDCGAVCAALQSATGRAPDVVLGKPDPCMIRGILHRHHLQPSQLAMVGDRLYTDMAMARRAGAVGVLVLTGEAKAHEAQRMVPPPDYIVNSLAELGERLREARDEDSPSQGSRCEPLNRAEVAIGVPALAGSATDLGDTPNRLKPGLQTGEVHGGNSPNPGSRVEPPKPGSAGTLPARVTAGCSHAPAGCRRSQVHGEGKSSP